MSAPSPIVAKLLNPTTGVLRGLSGMNDPADKVVGISVGELREIDAAIRQLNDECERAWEAYRIAHTQAMLNGERGEAA